MWHLMGMWLMLLFVIVHVYMAIRAEVMSRSNSVGVIMSGWRTWKDGGPSKPQ
jgi:Ni/Fe-hydrogenase 1 B-type cytochrome subunit